MNAQQKQALTKYVDNIFGGDDADEGTHNVARKFGVDTNDDVAFEAFTDVFSAAADKAAKAARMMLEAKMQEWLDRSLTVRQTMPMYFAPALPAGAGGFDRWSSRAYEYWWMHWAREQREYELWLQEG